MNAKIRSMAIAALVGIAMFPGQIAAVSSLPFARWSGPAGDTIADEVLVKFKPVFSVQYRASAVASQGHAAVADMNPPGWMRVKLGAGQSMLQALAAYQNHPDVEVVQPNYIYRAAAIPNDSLYGQLWALKNSGQTITAGTYVPNSGTAGTDINIENAWDHITDCSSIVVAVVDSGVNYDQADLAANMWDGGPGFPRHGIDTVDNDSDPMDLNGHGTHVAGIIGAVGNNAAGVTGVCWKASLMAVRVLDARGQGNTADIVSGINFAVAHGARVINISIGGNAFDPLLNDAITNAQSSDVVVVVAAGNAARDNDLAGQATYPCNFAHPNLVCVAALDQTYALARFSSWGATSVDVGAPGTNILSAWAGTRSTITEPFNTGGVLNWTTSGGGWAYRKLSFAGSAVDALANPTTFPAGTYGNNADQRVYKAFDLSGSDAAVLRFSAQVAVLPGDALNLRYRSTGGDPFAGGVQLEGGSGTTGGAVVDASYDLSPCISATCSVGFQLLTDAAGADQGAGILFFGIATLRLNDASFEIDNGTSMATPEVAGLAAMLRAYNPQFTYTDVVNAIKNGGRPIPALSGKTTTGKAIDVMSSLAYINPPTGVTATVQQGRR